MIKQDENRFHIDLLKTELKVTLLYDNEIKEDLLSFISNIEKAINEAKTKNNN